MLRRLAVQLCNPRVRLSLGERTAMVFIKPTIFRPFSSGDVKISADVQDNIMELGRKFIEKVKDGKVDKFGPNATFEELGMDSLDAVDFIVALEEHFGFDISNEDAENRIRSIRDACVVFTEYYEKKSNPQNGGDSSTGSV